MKEPAESEKKPLKLLNWAAGAAVGVLGIWLITAAVVIYVLIFCDVSKAGQVGDTFGVANSLFSGLALVGLTLSLFHQVSSGKDDQSRQAIIDFEAHFFQLVGNFQSLLEGIAVPGPKGTEFRGRRAIRALAERLAERYGGFNYPDPEESMDDHLESVRHRYNAFYTGGIDASGAYSSGADDILGHYFRLFYHILKYVDGAKSLTHDQRLHYASLLRAHMSDPELRLIYYNALSRYGFKKLMRLVVKYNMFKNIDIEDLLELKHTSWVEYLAKKARLPFIAPKPPADMIE
jgi:hypothetical protein